MMRRGVAVGVVLGGGEEVVVERRWRGGVGGEVVDDVKRVGCGEGGRCSGGGGKAWGGGRWEGGLRNRGAGGMC